MVKLWSKIKQLLLKIFISDARRSGALKEFRGKYTLDTGEELGKIRDVISYLNKEKNQEVKMRLQAIVDSDKIVE